MEVRPEVVTRFNQALQAAIGQTAWAGSCSSWYKSASGRVINNWSSHATAYWWKTRKPDWGHFVLRHASDGGRYITGSQFTVDGGITAQ